jgi:hypothetical protein
VLAPEYHRDLEEVYLSAAVTAKPAPRVQYDESLSNEGFWIRFWGTVRPEGYTMTVSAPEVEEAI